MATFPQVQTLVDSASTAIEGGDYAAAETYLLRAQVLLVGVPDQISGPQQIFFHREQINQLLAHVRQARAAAGGLSRSKVTYANPSS